MNAMPDAFERTAAEYTVIRMEDLYKVHDNGYHRIAALVQCMAADARLLLIPVRMAARQRHFVFSEQLLH